MRSISNQSDSPKEKAYQIIGYLRKMLSNLSIFIKNCDHNVITM